jgi:hypothetical protein
MTMLLALAHAPLAARAQQADRCLAVAEAAGQIVPANYRPAELKATEVRLTFVGHSTWLIESPGGVKIATDYNDYLRPAVVPDIATMNRAHISHYSNFPDPAIKHVLGPFPMAIPSSSSRLRDCASATSATSTTR